MTSLARTIGLGALVAAPLVILGAPTAPAHGACSIPSGLPAGALPDQPPLVNCTKLGKAPRTAKSSPNRWRDSFDDSGDFRNFRGAGYSLFTRGNVRARYWRHKDHWMVDMVSKAGGFSTSIATIRPNRSFRFIKGKRFSAGGTFASAMPSYGDQSWGEITITTAKRPTGRRNGALYAYDFFPGHWTIGCRLQTDRTMICSLFDGSKGQKPGGGRKWEMSFFQKVGTTSFGGFPAPGQRWRRCGATEPDKKCRDHFVVSLRPRSLEVKVNGKRYFRQTGIPRLPKALTNRPLYVYYSSVVNRHQGPGIRYHWDKATVN